MEVKEKMEECNKRELEECRGSESVNESVNGRVQLLNLCQDATESHSYSYIATGIIILLVR